MRAKDLTKELGSSMLYMIGGAEQLIVLIYLQPRHCDPRDLSSINSQSRIVSPFLHFLNQWYHESILYTQDEVVIDI